ncbi:MAG TPA: hypothetical protein VGM06_19340 [Polyangiaceae bacterium]|jgi:hypothetical protein
MPAVVHPASGCTEVEPPRDDSVNPTSLALQTAAAELHDPSEGAHPPMAAA